MLLRELHSVATWIADVRVRHRTYSQAIKVELQALTMEQAKRMLQAQYGKDSQILSIKFFISVIH